VLGAKPIQMPEETSGVVARVCRGCTSNRGRCCERKTECCGREHPSTRGTARLAEHVRLQRERWRRCGRAVNSVDVIPTAGGKTHRAPRRSRRHAPRTSDHSLSFRRSPAGRVQGRRDRARSASRCVQQGSGSRDPGPGPTVHVNRGRTEAVWLMRAPRQMNDIRFFDSPREPLDHRKSCPTGSLGPN
jgi:hypothetical protein